MGTETPGNTPLFDLNMVNIYYICIYIYLLIDIYIDTISPNRPLISNLANLYILKIPHLQIPPL